MSFLSARAPWHNLRWNEKGGGGRHIIMTSSLHATLRRRPPTKSSGSAKIWLDLDL